MFSNLLLQLGILCENNETENCYRLNKHKFFTAVVFYKYKSILLYPVWTLLIQISINGKYLQV